MSLFQILKHYYNCSSKRIRPIFLLPVLVTTLAVGTFQIVSASSSKLFHFESNSIKIINDSEFISREDLTGDTLYVREFVLALDVVEREPVEIVSSYNMSNARAWCFVRLYNSENIQDIFFKWYYEDDLYFEMNSKIGTSSNWRTYSSVGLQPGSWRVVLEDNRGEKLDETRFHVSE